MRPRWRFGLVGTPPSLITFLGPLRPVALLDFVQRLLQRLGGAALALLVAGLAQLLPVGLGLLARVGRPRAAPAALGRLFARRPPRSRAAGAARRHSAASSRRPYAAAGAARPRRAARCHAPRPSAAASAARRHHAASAGPRRAALHLA